MDIDVLMFECSGMKNGEKFPVVNTGRGQDISPGFIIKNLSSYAKTLAITLEDIKYPLFKDFTHWLVWNIPASEKIEAAIPGGKVVPGFRNAGQEIGYGWYRYAGPKPPKGKQHLYRFTKGAELLSRTNLCCSFKTAYRGGCQQGPMKIW